MDPIAAATVLSVDQRLHKIAKDTLSNVLRRYKYLVNSKTCVQCDLVDALLLSADFVGREDHDVHRRRGGGYYKIFNAPKTIANLCRRTGGLKGLLVRMQARREGEERADAKRKRDELARADGDYEERQRCLESAKQARRTDLAARRNDALATRVAKLDAALAGNTHVTSTAALRLCTSINVREFGTFFDRVINPTVKYTTIVDIATRAEAAKCALATRIAKLDAALAGNTHVSSIAALKTELTKLWCRDYKTFVGTFFDEVVTPSVEHTLVVDVATRVEAAVARVHALTAAHTDLGPMTKVSVWKHALDCVKGEIGQRIPGDVFALVVDDVVERFDKERIVRRCTAFDTRTGERCKNQHRVCEPVVLECGPVCGFHAT